MEQISEKDEENMTATVIMDQATEEKKLYDFFR